MKAHAGTAAACCTDTLPTSLAGRASSLTTHSQGLAVEGGELHAILQVGGQDGARHNVVGLQGGEGWVRRVGVLAGALVGRVLWFKGDWAAQNGGIVPPSCALDAKGDTKGSHRAAPATRRLSGMGTAGTASLADTHTLQQRSPARPQWCQHQAARRRWWPAGPRTPAEGVATARRVESHTGDGASGPTLPVCTPAAGEGRRRRGRLWCTQRWWAASVPGPKANRRVTQRQR